MIMKRKREKNSGIQGAGYELLPCMKKDLPGNIVACRDLQPSNAGTLCQA